MDIDALHSALLSLTLLSDQIRSARESVSVATGPASSGFTELLNGLGRDLRIAKATLARELGFAVCHCCWPPEVMLADVGGPARCPASSKSRPDIRIVAELPSPAAKPPRKTTRKRRMDSFARAQKEKLLRLRDALVESIAGVAKGNFRSHANGTDAASFVGDLADAGRDASERDLALSLLSQEHNALTEIDQALERIEQGTYGICEISGKPIPRARLEAIPFARHTVECQSGIEKQRKASRTRQPVTPLFSMREEDVEEDGEEEEDPPDKKRESGQAGSTIRIEYEEASTLRSF